MEADWEVEIGGDVPVIEAHWTGFVDLRAAPDRIARLPESAAVPALGDALQQLHAPSSPVWTSKCDVWHPEEFDPDELDATAEAKQRAIACYIDLLPRSADAWSIPEQAVAACKALCARLRERPLQCCRVDLVVRGACIEPGVQSLGITAYVTACGAMASHAAATLALALNIFVESVLNIARPAEDTSKLQ